MITVTTALRFTIVPRAAKNGRFLFSALITPTVSTKGQLDDNDPKKKEALAVQKVAHLWNWPTTIGLPLGGFLDEGNAENVNKPQRLQIGIRKAGAAALTNVEFQMDLSWMTKADSYFDPNLVLELWQQIMQRAWIGPEDKDTAGATADRKNIAKVDSSIVQTNGRPAVSQVTTALQKGQSTVEGMTTAALNPIAARLYTSRLLDVPYPIPTATDKDGAKQRSQLEEYGFLLSRQNAWEARAKRVSSSNRKARAAVFGNGADLSKEREFHQIISGFGNHPKLLRALGLVFDFSIDGSAAAKLDLPDLSNPQLFAISATLTDAPPQDNSTPNYLSIVNNKRPIQIMRNRMARPSANTEGRAMKTSSRSRLMIQRGWMRTGASSARINSTHCSGT